MYRTQQFQHCKNFGNCGEKKTHFHLRNYKKNNLKYVLITKYLFSYWGNTVFSTIRDNAVQSDSRRFWQIGRKLYLQKFDLNNSNDKSW